MFRRSDDGEKGSERGFREAGERKSQIHDAGEPEKKNGLVVNERVKDLNKYSFLSGVKQL